MDALALVKTVSMNDEVLSAARSGSQDAGRRLVAEFGPSMLRTAWNVLGRYGGSEAEDVVQEAFVAALTTRALPTGDLGAWLRAIVARKALDSLRRERRRGERPLDEPRHPADEVSSGPSASARLEVLTVRQGLARLSAADRAVLTLVDLEGYSMAEAAETLGLTNVAVRLRAVRARRKLARWLRREIGSAGRRSEGERGAS